MTTYKIYFPNGKELPAFEADRVIESISDILVFFNGGNEVAIVPKTCLVMCNE